MTARQGLGALGERLAAQHLERAGLVIVARNVRIDRNEVDLVARDGETLVFVEVRTRRGAAGAGAESVTAAKLARVAACARAWCEREGVDPELTRLDVVAVELDARGRALGCRHFRGVEVPGL